MLFVIYLFIYFTHLIEDLMVQDMALNRVKQHQTVNKHEVIFTVYILFKTMRVLFNGSIIPCYLTNKDASTVLCSVVKHAGSGRAQKK